MIRRPETHLPAEGFLSQDVAASVERIKLQFAPWFRVATRFSNLGMRLLPALKPNTIGNQQLLAHMPMLYGEHVIAGLGGMARAAHAQGRT
jgi:hypothetical protein